MPDFRQRFLALGDSYTIGEGVAAAEALAGATGAAPARATAYAIDDPEIVATTGWTTDELVRCDGRGRRSRRRMRWSRC